MSQRVFRVGIIGLGGMGHQHALACRDELGAELVAGCDVSEAQRQKWGHAFSIADEALYADWEEMLDRERLDVAIVATHANLHHGPVLAAAAHGVHVLCEKPPALVLREADEMVAACEAAGVRMSVNHIKRGSRGSAIAMQLIASGVIGAPYLVRGEAKGRRWAASELMEMGTHLFDWLRLLMGDPHWLFADIQHEGLPAQASDIIHSLDLPYAERDCGLVLGQRAYCALGLPGGVHADVHFLEQPTADDVGYGFDIVGTEGTLALRRSVGTELFLQRGYHRGPLRAKEWETIAVDEFAAMSPMPSANEAGERLAIQRRILRELFAAIEEGREPDSSGNDGRAALELVMAVWQSHREGRPVTLPLASREHPLEVWRTEANAL